MRNMKIIILFLSILYFSSNANAEIPEYNSSLNENINKYGWKLKSTKSKKVGKAPAELYTLKKDGYILKCISYFRMYSSETECFLP